MDTKTARHTFKIRGKMLRDLHASVEATTHSIAIRVLRRRFDKYFNEVIEAYDTLVASEPDDLEDLGREFSELNLLSVTVETKAEEVEAGPSATVKPDQTAGGSQQGGGLAAKLPFIQLGQFDGNPMDWVSFHDLFLSLVHDRPHLPDAEKHYYLRSCLVGEPLTLVKHLPVDAANYEVALGLLRDRYDNKRLLADTYLGQIMSLPIIASTLEGLRQSFYSPLLESTQALQKLGLPVAEWSYLLTYLILQKLPSQLRSQFEERSGVAPGDLPTFTALMTFLDEVCRRQLIGAPPPERETAEPMRRHSPLTAQRRKTPSAGGRYSPPTNKVRGQMTPVAGEMEVRCPYCTYLGHILLDCYEFKRLSRSARKTWARSNGACFVCLGQHYARECAQGNGCRLCGSKYHHTLLCTAGEAPRHATQQPPRAPPRAKTPPRSRTPPRRASLVNHQRPLTSPRRDPEQEQPRSYNLQPGQRPVGARYQLAQAQFEDLRYGRPTFIPKREPEEDF